MKLKITLLFLISLAVSALLLEISVRALGLDESPIAFSHPSFKGEFLAFDPALGWKNLRNHTYWYGDIPFTTNAQGFRFSRDFDRKKTRPRMAIIGDSQVFGLLVKMEDHFARLLNAGRGNFEVYPFGVPGYGPAQELLLLKRTVLDYDPDLVVAVLFLENDLIDTTLKMNHGYKQKPYVDPEARGVEVLNVPVPIPIKADEGFSKMHLRPDAFLFKWSGIFRALAYTLSARGIDPPESLPRRGWFEIIDSSRLKFKKDFLHGFGFSRVDGLEIECAHGVSCPRDHVFDGLPVAIRIYRAMDYACALRGVKFAVLITPSAKEMLSDRFQLTRRVAHGLRVNGLEVVDLSEYFAADGRPGRAFIGDDFHWNREGHRLAARAIRAELVPRIAPAAR